MAISRLNSSLNILNTDILTLIIEQLVNDKETLFRFALSHSTFLTLCLEVFNKLPTYYAIYDNQEKYLSIRIDDECINPTQLKTKLNFAISEGYFNSIEFNLYPDNTLESDMIHLQNKSEINTKKLFGGGGFAFFKNIGYQPTLFKVKSNCNTTKTTGNNLYFESAIHTVSDNIHKYPINNSIVNRKQSKL